MMSKVQRRPVQAFWIFASRPRKTRRMMTVKMHKSGSESVNSDDKTTAHQAIGFRGLAGADGVGCGSGGGGTTSAAAAISPEVMTRRSAASRFSGMGLSNIISNTRS